MSDLTNSITEIRNDIVGIKTSQITGNDSALLYKQVYSPGEYNTMYGYRFHTIRCITEYELSRAIFMPFYPIRISPQEPDADNSAISTETGLIYWTQTGPITRFWDYSGDDSRLFRPKDLIIYSNVPFTITATYQDFIHEY